SCERPLVVTGQHIPLALGLKPGTPTDADPRPPHCVHPARIKMQCAVVHVDHGVLHIFERLEDRDGLLPFSRPPSNIVVVALVFKNHEGVACAIAMKRAPRGRLASNLRYLGSMKRSYRDRKAR